MTVPLRPPLYPDAPPRSAACNLRATGLGQVLGAVGPDRAPEGFPRHASVVASKKTEWGVLIPAFRQAIQGAARMERRLGIVGTGAFILRGGRAMKRLGLWVAVVAAIVLPPQFAEAAFTFTYTGTLHFDGSDHGGIEGAAFTFTAVFPSSPYMDYGAGQPYLPATSLSFTVSGAPVADHNGEWGCPAPSSFVMLPTLGGRFNAPSGFSKPDVRMWFNWSDLSGGDGLEVAVGDMPSVSHFPTFFLSEPIMIVQPHNINYDIINPSIPLREPNPVPEPSTLVMFAGLGAMGLIGAWRKRKRQDA